MEPTGHKTKLAAINSGEEPIATVRVKDDGWVDVRLFTLDPSVPEDVRMEMAHNMVKAVVALTESVAKAFVEMKLAPCGHVACGMNAITSLIAERAAQVAKESGSELEHMQVKGHG